jgi:hypothetical protein
MKISKEESDEKFTQQLNELNSNLEKSNKKLEKEKESNKEKIEMMNEELNRKSQETEKLQQTMQVSSVSYFQLETKEIFQLEKSKSRTKKF